MYGDPDDPDDLYDPHDPESEADPRPSESLQRAIHRLSSRPMAMGSVLPLLTPLYHGWYRECVQCGRLVGADGAPYYVERALRRGEPVFEYAMCESCVFGMQNDLSRESIERVTAYWMQHFDPEERQHRLGNGLDPGPLVEACILKRLPRADLDELQVWAWVENGRLMVDDHAPGILSGDAVEEIANLLSKRTRDRFDDFVRDCLGLPPELCNVPILI
jgi:hypothetical protein